MSARILNRDVQPHDVPTVHATSPELSDEGHGAAWAKIWRFSRTFEPTEYCAATGKRLDAEAVLSRIRSQVLNRLPIDAGFAEMRAALAWLREESSDAIASPDNARLIDALLDAIYVGVSGGESRPRGDLGPYEPALGIWGASLGNGQHRFWFSQIDQTSRCELFDRVAGILLRETDRRAVVSALYLYPPAYPTDADRPALHIFMLLLEDRRKKLELTADELGRYPNGWSLDQEYDRLAEFVVSALADKRFDYAPTT